MKNNADIEWVEVSGGDGTEKARVSKTPVTVEQFARFLQQGGYGAAGQQYWSVAGWHWLQKLGITEPAYWNQPEYDNPHMPVTGVSYFEAEAYAQFANASLPTESEWAALASNQGQSRYPWGEDRQDIPLQRANLSFFGIFRPSGLTPVTQFPAGANRDGILDLIGNVAEWCKPDIALAETAEMKTGALRGGCFWHAPEAVDAHFRDEVTPEVRDNQTGIRLIRRPVVVKRPAPASDPDALDSRPAGASQPAARPISRFIARPTRPFRQEGIPADLDEATWRLEIAGAVAQPRSLSLNDLKTNYLSVTQTGLFVCVCRWGEVNTIRGVLLRDLIEDVRPLRPLEELYLLQRSIPGPDGKIYETSISVADAVANDALLCYEMDGKPLSLEFGWPLRLMAFHLYGYKLVKCLGQLVFTTEFTLGWWEEWKRYDPVGTVRPGVITVIGQNPFKHEILEAGRVALKEVRNERETSG